MILPDLQDTSLQNSNWPLFSVDSCMAIDRVQRAGVAVVMLKQTIWSEVLSPGTYAQDAELIALTWALEAG